MDQYDPLLAPDPEVWQALDEESKIELIDNYHKTLPERLPKRRVHAIFTASRKTSSQCGSLKLRRR